MSIIIEAEILSGRLTKQGHLKALTSLLQVKFVTLQEHVFCITNMITMLAVTLLFMMLFSQHTTWWLWLQNINFLSPTLHYSANFQYYQQY